MSWQNKEVGHRMRGVVAACLLPLVLASCGFQPLYGQHIGGDAKTAVTVHQLAGIEIGQVSGGASGQPSPGILGQQLRNNIEDRLNPGKIIAPESVYHLDISLSLRETGVAVSRDGTISRYNIFLDTTYVLTRKVDGKPVYQGRFSRSSSYNVQSNAYFSTYVSRGDSIKHGIVELAEEYRQRLAAFLVQQSGKLAPPIMLKKQPELPSSTPFAIPIPGYGQSPADVLRGREPGL